MSNRSTKRPTNGPGQSDTDECTICVALLDPADTYTFANCGHKFHTECISNWICTKGNPHNTCPNCRMEIDQNSRAKLCVEKRTCSSCKQQIRVGEDAYNIKQHWFHAGCTFVCLIIHDGIIKSWMRGAVITTSYTSYIYRAVFDQNSKWTPVEHKLFGLLPVGIFNSSHNAVNVPYRDSHTNTLKLFDRGTAIIPYTYDTIVSIISKINPNINLSKYLALIREDARGKPGSCTCEHCSQPITPGEEVSLKIDVGTGTPDSRWFHRGCTKPMFRFNKDGKVVLCWGGFDRMSYANLPDHTCIAVSEHHSVDLTADTIRMSRDIRNFGIAYEDVQPNRVMTILPYQDGDITRVVISYNVSGPYRNAIINLSDTQTPVTHLCDSEREDRDLCEFVKNVYDYVNKLAESISPHQTRMSIKSPPHQRATTKRNTTSRE